MQNKEAFLASVRAGLWERGESVSGEGLAVSGTDVLRMAEEQSVVGLVAAGIRGTGTSIHALNTIYSLENRYLCVA